MIKKVYEELKIYVPFLIFLINAYGYISLKIYYSNYEIPIHNYVNITDYLFFSIEILLIIGSGYVLTEIVSIGVSYVVARFVTQLKLRGKSIRFRSNFRRVKYRYFRCYYRRFYSRYQLFIPVVLYIIILIRYIVFVYLESILILKLITGIALYSAAKASIKIHKRRKVQDFFSIPMIAVVLILMTTIPIIYIGIAENRPNNKKAIIFKSGDCIYKTRGGRYLYVGETTDYIFLHDVHCKESLIFRKDNIENIRIFNIGRD